MSDVFGYTEDRIKELQREARKLLTGTEEIREGARVRLQLYSLAFVIIDGSLQSEETMVDVRCGQDKTRVYVRWACPAEGFEWDGRKAVGTGQEFKIAVMGPAAESPVVNRMMKCTWFAFGHKVGQASHARAIFECAGQALPVYGSLA